MPVIREGKIISNDPWVMRAEEEEAPAKPYSIVSLKSWLAQEGGRKQNPSQTAVLLEPDEKPESLAEHLSQIPLVVLRFDTFKDGRAFSQAAILRSQYGYKGEIRAIGHILKDQLLFLHRCGVNSVEADDRISPKDWEDAMKEFSYFYQPATDGITPVLTKWLPKTE